MATPQSRYILSAKFELQEQGKEGEAPMWTLENVYNGLDYDGVVKLQKLIAGMGVQLTALADSVLAEMKGKPAK